MSEPPVIGSLIFGALWVLFLLAVYAVLFHIGPRVAAALKIMRQSTAEVMEDAGDRDEWDSHTEDAILLTHENRDDEETNGTAADFILWDAAMGERPEVHEYLRRMERWSR